MFDGRHIVYGLPDTFSLSHANTMASLRARRSDYGNPYAQFGQQYGGQGYPLGQYGGQNFVPRGGPQGYGYMPQGQAMYYAASQQQAQQHGTDASGKPQPGGGGIPGGGGPDGGSGSPGGSGAPVFSNAVSGAQYGGYAPLQGMPYLGSGFSPQQPQASASAAGLTSNAPGLEMLNFMTGDNGSESNVQNAFAVPSQSRTGVPLEPQSLVSGLGGL